MNINNDYIIKQWNLSQIQNIDFDKSFIQTEDNYLVLHLKLKRSNNHCPICMSESIRIHGSKKQMIKHALLDLSFGVICFHKRIFKCDMCGHVFSEYLNNFKYAKNVSFALEFAVLEKLRDLKLTYKYIADLYHISDTFVASIFDKHVNISPKTLPEVLSIDEIYARKLTKTKYCCVLMDPINKKLIDVLYSRRKELLLPYFSRKSREEKNKVKYFICDLNDTYRDLAYKSFFNITVAADSFHVIKNLTEAFNKVRITVMKEHEELRDYSMEYWLLKKFNWMLETDISEIKKDYYDFQKWHMSLSKYQLLDYILKVDERLTEAYYLKEAYRQFNQYYHLSPNDDQSEIYERLEELISAFKISKSPALISFGNTLNSWKKEIVNSFIYLGDFRLSNSIIERFNGSIKLLMANSYGFTNFDRARLRMIYSVNHDEAFSPTNVYRSNRYYTGQRGHYKK